jgi:predicted transcriptional regulator
MSSINGLTNGRRDELSIMKDLLGNMNQPVKLTHMLYRTNLSYAQMKKYLDNLIQMGLAEEIKDPFRSFKITEKGRMFMQIVAAHNINGLHNKAEAARTV